MNKINLRKIVVLLFIITILCFGIVSIYFVVNGFSFDMFENVKFTDANFDTNNKNAKVVEYNKSFDAIDVKSINISIISSELKILREDRKDIEIDFDGKYTIYGLTFKLPKPKVKIVGNTLYFEEGSFKGMVFNFKNYSSLSVKIPKEMELDQLNINGVSSSIYLENESIDKLAISTVSGTIDMKNIKCSELSAETISGSINVLDSLGNKNNVSSTSGTITISTKTVEQKLNCETVSGDINISVPKDMNTNISFNTVSGDIISDIGINTASNSENYKCKTVSGNLIIKER